MEIQGKDIDTLFFRYQDSKDLEIIATIIALFTDGYSYHMEHVNHVLFDIMNGKPYDYVMQFKMRDTQDIAYELKYEPIGGFVTLWNLCHLVYHLADVYMNYGTLSFAFRSVVSKQKVKYGHEALIQLFGNDAGFQSKKGNGTFYRLNFLLCLLTQKMGLLELEDDEAKKCLLPCDDDVFNYMLKRKVISSNETILPNVVKITDYAKSKYPNGACDFYWMYYECKHDGHGLL